MPGWRVRGLGLTGLPAENPSPCSVQYVLGTLIPSGAAPPDVCCTGQIRYAATQVLGHNDNCATASMLPGTDCTRLCIFESLFQNNLTSNRASNSSFTPNPGSASSWSMISGVGCCFFLRAIRESFQKAVWKVQRISAELVCLCNSACRMRTH